ncbi:MAG: AraC family transcriptional regulator [Hungatella sp.]|nr:AraC family transcriptional regulator [Hungatella sp.]
MRNIKYTDSAQFQCLEHLREAFMDLYLVHCGIEHCRPSHSLGPAFRDEYIIHFVLDGKGSYSVGGITYFLSSNQMFLIYPGEEVRYSADPDEPWTYAWIGFNGIRSESTLKSCGFSRQCYVLPFKKQETLLEYISSILNSAQLSFSNDLKRNASLLLIFSFLVENYNHISGQASKSGETRYDYGSNVYVEQAIDYIKWNHNRGINVTDIADYIGISRTYLNHVFQKELGISSQKFLMDYRLHKAANLLISSDLPVTEVSAEVGYDDSLAFSKAFKKKFGLSPKNYRSHKEIMDRYSEKQPSTNELLHVARS